MSDNSAAKPTEPIAQRAKRAKLAAAVSLD